VWRVDHLAGAGIADPVVTLVFGAPELEYLFVGGWPVVDGGVLTTADPAALAMSAALASKVIAAG
jgi:8-oxoguanine deaminase